jgi:serine/threonine protein phosphatase 1
MIHYALTDCHGRLDMLEAAYDAIVAHADGQPARVVFMGDAIDRGPNSKGCIDRLIRGAGAPNFAAQVNLLGNHEEMMMDALAGDSRAIAHWLDNGGGETVHSYLGGSGPDPARAMAEFELPPEHAAWLIALEWSFETDTHIFVHAGIPPGASLAQTLGDPHARRQLIWIRGRFLSTPYDFGKHVLHGHSPVGRVDFTYDPPFRTNLDTGAVYGGPLTVGVCHPGAGGKPELISIANPGPDFTWNSFLC